MYIVSNPRPYIPRGPSQEGCRKEKNAREKLSRAAGKGFLGNFDQNLFPWEFCLHATKQIGKGSWWIEAKENG